MRLLTILKTELAADKLKLEEDLERVINNKDLETNIKVANVKSLLERIAIVKSTFETFEDYLGEDKDGETKE
jgi:hypothetical protein